MPRPTIRGIRALPTIGNQKGFKSADQGRCQSEAARQAKKDIDALEGADYEH
jgi:hypothetical protein